MNKDMKTSNFILKTLQILAFVIIALNTNGQTPTAFKNTDEAQIKIWLKDLYEPGVSVTEDSVFINAEASKLINDEQYRNLLYPKTYSWQAAIVFIQKQELKKAFWYFINLYSLNEKNKEIVVKAILAYDKLFKMDKILVSTFYTYSLIDPEIGSIVNGQSKITAPHILEKKLQVVKELLFYLDKYRTEKKDIKATIK